MQALLSLFVGQVGKASKISKAKTVLKGLEELSESKADELVEKLIIKGKTIGVIATTDDFIFDSARQFVRNKYGQRVLNQFIEKFGISNEGAVAVIVQKWGDEGVEILNKTTCKSSAKSLPV
uniref:hypothetical protein n=1 Tax=Ornithobacterium rhinotracheale TaxID=28251 RepID=UPI0039A61BF9